MNLKPRKIGKFMINDELLTTISWEDLGSLLSRTGMLIVRAEHRLDYAAIEYVALCKMFDEITEAFVVPEYRPEIEHKDHVLSIYFRRVT